MSDTPASPTADASSRRDSFFWPAMIVGLLVVHGLAVLVCVFIATRDRSFAVEPGYYQKGLHWDQIAKQQQTNALLGWNATIAIRTDVDALGRRAVTCRLTNRPGQPLDGAQIELVAFAHARAADRTTVTLEPKGDGTYQTTLRLNRPGIWEFRLVVRRGPETFTYREQRRV